MIGPGAFLSCHRVLSPFLAPFQKGKQPQFGLGQTVLRASLWQGLRRGAQIQNIGVDVTVARDGGRVVQTRRCGFGHVLDARRVVGIATLNAATVPDHVRNVLAVTPSVPDLSAV